MIKVPSINSIGMQLVATLKRFPLVVISAILLATSLSYITHQRWDFKEHESYLWGKLSMCAALGLSLFLATSLLSEAKGYTLKGKAIVQLLTLGVILGYYFTIENYEEFNLDSFTRYTLYIIAAHLFVAFAAFTGANSINSFWQFNKTLFLRFLLSMLYTVVLYGGIALAFWLIDDLLHVEIKYTKYAYVWYFLSAVLNTLIFISGIPKDLSALENDTSYLKGLKVFTQFVFLPLVSLYLIILYIYFGKIIIHWSLPKGYVSYLVISFSIMGILSLLLIYPIRDNEGNKWIKIFSRWFYVALYPLIILLGVSIYHRISEYGITEHRYFILVLAAWLVFIASYFLLSKKENIKIIPITLFIFAILTSAGPWGAFSISRHSQKNRLEQLLITNGILINGKVVKTSKPVNDSIRDNISSILRYLEEANSIKMLQPWFSINLDSIHANNWSYYDRTDTLLRTMGLSSQYSHYNSNSFELDLDNRYSKAAINVKGFDYYADFSYRHYQTDSEKSDTVNSGDYFMEGNDSISFTPFHLPCKYALVKHGKTIAVLELLNFVSALHAQDTASDSYEINVPENKFMYEVKGIDSVIYCFRFSSIRGTKESGKFSIDNIDAAVLTKHL